VTLLAGRAADRLVYGQVYSGAESDLKQATRLARMMVTHWGMSEKVGPMAFRVGEEHTFLGKEIQEARDFSEGTAQVIDEELEAREMLDDTEVVAIVGPATPRRGDASSGDAGASAQAARDSQPG